MENIISFDIGGTEIKYGVINEGKIVFSHKVKTPSNRKNDLIVDKVIEIANDLKIKYNAKGIGISTAGVIDPFTGEIVQASDTIYNYTGTKIKKLVEEKTSLLTFVENDVNCAGLAEFKAGNGKGYESFFMVTVGTGIGGALYLNDKLINGASFSAGECGQMIMGNTQFQKKAAMSVLVKNVQKIRNIENGYELFKLYDNNDLEVKKIVDKFYKNLAIGLSNIVYLINPNVIVVGGGVTNRGEKFLEELKIAIKKVLPEYFLSKLDLKIAHFKNDAGILGAYYNFIYRQSQKNPK